MTPALTRPRQVSARMSAQNILRGRGISIPRTTCICRPATQERRAKILVEGRRPFGCSSASSLRTWSLAMNDDCLGDKRDGTTASRAEAAQRY
eukprot:6202835-Prymnesium_polylepis.3